jgi:hypothetical protein
MLQSLTVIGTRSLSKTLCEVTRGVMKNSKATAILACLMVMGVVGSGIGALAQGNGRGGNGHGGEKAPHGNGRGLEHQGRERQAQPQIQQYVVQQNRGNDRRAEMRPRMQQIQQQRQPQVQPLQQSRGNHRRAEMQQRMQQIQQQRQVQAQPWEQQYRGSDRRTERLQRMPEFRQQRELQVQQRTERPERYGNGRYAGRWKQQDWRDSPEVRRGGRDLRPQIIPEPKAKDWFRRAEGNGYRERQPTAGFYQRQYGAVRPRNYGQLRREQVHQRNTERWRERHQYLNSWSGTRAFPGGGIYARNLFDYEIYLNMYPQRHSSNDNYSQQSVQRYYTNRGDGYYGAEYAEPSYGDSDYSRPKAEDIFRSVIFAVLNGGFGDQGQEYQVSNSTPFYDPYSSAYLEYQGRGYPPKYSYATDPAYYDPYFHEDPQYSEVLPMQYFVGNEPGSGSSSRCSLICSQ